jgi:hypothetical protein
VSAQFPRFTDRILIHCGSTCYNLKDLISIHITENNVREEKTYEIPRGLLSWYSSYFAAALDPNSDLAIVDGKLRLEEDVKVFDAFECWLWTGKLKDVSHTLADPKPDDHYLSEQLLYRIWVFGDMRGVPGLRNVAIDMLHEQLAAKCEITMHAIPYIYANTTPGAALRKYVVDEFSLTSSVASVLEVTADEVTSEFSTRSAPRFDEQGSERQEYW